MKSSKKDIRKKEKSEMIQNCFWIPERTPESISENQHKPIE